MGAGHSIAVQNFNENLSILAMTGLYFLMISADLSIYLGDHPLRVLRQRHDAARQVPPSRRTSAFATT
jgi:hypothetical protein